MEAESWSLMTMKKKRSDKLAHLLDVFINIIEFTLNDEDDVSHRSEYTEVQKYVIKMLHEIDDDD